MRISDWSSDVCSSDLANCSSAVARGVSEIERVDDRGSAQADVPSTRNARTPIHCLRRNCFITRLPWARHLLHCFCCDAAERGATWDGREGGLKMFDAKAQRFR